MTKTLTTRLGRDVFELEDRMVMSTTTLTGLSALTSQTTAPRGATIATVSPRIIESVITIKNPTGNTLTYYLQFGSSNWQMVTLQPGQQMVHRAAGANRLGVISFDGLAARGYQEIRYTLCSKNFVTGGREVWNRTAADGMQYNFQVNLARTGWDLMRESGINTSRNATLRAEAARSFENLGTNFEILGAKTGSSLTPGSYNCIAWSLGEVNKWIFPDVNRAGDLSYWDALYGSLGYQRMSTLDLSFQPGYQKVVVYWGANQDQFGRMIPGITHAALQESDGMWSSKTGGGYLIKHASAYQVAGQLYGQPAFVYIRPIA
jgi:hypothetical protein